MTPSNPAAVTRRFQAVMARAIERSDREAAEAAERLRAKPMPPSVRPRAWRGASGRKS
jgi:hypothetical protein